MKAANQRRLEYGLRGIIDVADRLLGCPTIDAIFKVAVEGAREKLGVERCAIFVERENMICGTFGTDMRGRTTDERRLKFPGDEGWRLAFRQRETRQLWKLLPDAPIYTFDGRNSQIAGYGWVACTPIAQSGQEPVALFCNDAAITRSPFDPVRQDLVAVFCSLLATVVQRKQADAVIRESEHKFRSLCETTSASIFLFQGTKLTYLNPAAEEITGYPREQLQRMNFWDVIHPEFRELVRQRGLARQRGDKIPPRYEVKIRTSTGQDRWIDYNSSVVEVGGRPAVLGVALDITQRKIVEQQLKDIIESERLMLGIATAVGRSNASTIGRHLSAALRKVAGRLNAHLGTLIVFSDDAQSIARVHEGRLAGIGSVKPLLERVALKKMPISDVALRGQAVCISRLSELPRNARYEREVARRIGIRSFIVVPVVRRQSVLGVLTIGRKTEGAWKPEETSFAELAGEILFSAWHRQELESEHERLAKSVLALQEEERKEISATLHDDLGQILTLTAIELDRLKVRGEAPAGVIDKVNDRVGQVLASVRDLAVSLRPPILDDLAIGTSLKALCRDFGRRVGLQVRCRIGRSPRRLTESESTCLYRVLQEALTNVARHAGAKKVIVSFGARDGWLEMEIGDDGSGFTVDAESRRRGIGLIGMKERMRQCGGTLEISSMPGTGTRVIARLSLGRNAVGRILRRN
jgi:PAS domain S-box-containing protein